MIKLIYIFDSKLFIKNQLYPIFNRIHLHDFNIHLNNIFITSWLQRATNPYRSTEIHVTTKSRTATAYASTKKRVKNKKL